MSDFPEVFEYGGYGVNCKLTEMRTNKDVVWVRGNSFVLVKNEERGPFFAPNGDRVDLVSINGIGEVRWPVWERDIESAEQYELDGKLDPKWDCAMHLEAYRHFDLEPYTVDRGQPIRGESWSFE